MNSAELPGLWESYVPTPGVRVLRLDGRCLLYSQDHQQLLELNETAERIWRALVVFGSVSMAALDVAALGLSVRQAMELVRETARQWTLGGFLAPRALEALLESDCSARSLALDELVVDFLLHGVDGQELDVVFGHLYARRDGARRRLAIIEHAGQLLFYVERRLVHAGESGGLIAHVKAILTDLYVEAVENGFLTHGALLLKGDSTLLLSAEPGAGKTTLALALAAAGWDYGGDDMVRISPEGAARGVPFAAAVKSGGVPLLRGMWPRLEQLPEWRRADGQRARYLLPPKRDLAARPLNVVVTLARRPGAQAQMTRISQVDALRAIVDSACARRWSMTGEALCCLAGTLNRAVCARLEYSDLEPAVQAIVEVAGAPAQAA